MPEFSFPVEDLLTVLAAQGNVALEGAHELNDLRNVVVIFGISRACRGVEEVVAREQFKEHWKCGEGFNISLLHEACTKGEKRQRRERTT